MSVAPPRRCSSSIIDLYSLVNDSDSRNHIFHAPQPTPLPQLFPHDLPGDKINQLKAKNIFRIGFCNIGGFPASPPPNDKAQELKTFMALYDLDVFSGSEANLNWSKLLDNIHPSEWFKDVPSCRTFTAHNSTKNITRHQFGGTFWIGIRQATQYITSSSKDPSGLGWWSVCTLLSHSGRKLHIIFAYRPCKNLRSRLRSVYAQQRRHFDSIHRYVCPRLAFLSDLTHMIMEWTWQGEEVLLLADLNGDIRQQEISAFATTCDLSKSILSRHPTIPPPATFKRGDCPGCSRGVGHPRGFDTRCNDVRCPAQPRGSSRIDSQCPSVRHHWGTPLHCPLPSCLLTLLHYSWGLQPIPPPLGQLLSSPQPTPKTGHLISLSTNSQSRLPFLWHCDGKV